MPNFSAFLAARPRLGPTHAAGSHRASPGPEAGQGSNRQIGPKHSNREVGQVIVEYILALAIIIGVVTIVSTGFRRSLFRLWEFYGKQISAPCPGCPADPAVRLR